MAKIVKELLTKWTYRVDSRQLKATAIVIKNLHKSMMQVRQTSIGFQKGEVQRLRNIRNGWQGLNQEVRKYKSNLRGGLGGGLGGRGGRGGGGGGGRGGRGGRRGGLLGNQSTAFLAGNVLKSPVIGSALLAAGGNPAILGALAAAGGIATSVAAASRKQQATVGFETFARAESGGDADKAKKSTTEFMDQLEDFGKRTPFDVEKLRDLALQMKGFGFATKEVIPTLSQLGDLTGGRMDVLRRMLVNLAQIRNLGKAQTVDLKQIANAGIPIQQKLADMLGKTRQQIQAMIPAGQITAKHIARAFQEMTSEGGLFFGQMEERSKTLNGQWEKLKETITGVKTAIGEPFLDPLTSGLRITIQFIDSMKALSGAISVGVGNFGKLIAMMPFFEEQVAILKFLGKLWLLTFGLIPLILEDIGAFFDGKESFTGKLLKWLGLKEGESVTELLVRKLDKIKMAILDFFEELAKDAGSLWDEIVVTMNSDSFFKGMREELDAMDKWFENTALGKFIGSVFGQSTLEALRLGTGQTDVDPGAAPPTGDQSTTSIGGNSDNRSQILNINAGQGGIGEAIAAATDRGILGTGSRQFQSQFVS